MESERNSVKFPIIHLQPDWFEALSVNDEKVWISCKYKDEPGIYGHLQKSIDEDGVTRFIISDDFKIEKISTSFILIKHKNSNLLTCFVKPLKCWSSLHKQSIGSVSIAPNGLAASSSSDGSLIVWNTDKEDFKLDLSGHLGEVYRCRFFPSGLVVLSAGSDLRIRIWCAKTGRCPVTLIGHQKAVTDIDFVDRGRNVLSCSRDGRVKLWSCVDSSCIYDIIKLPTSINTCRIHAASKLLDLGAPNHEISDKEVNTSGKLVLVGCEDGTLHAVALQSHKQLFSIDLGSAVNSICFINSERFIVGCQDGSVHAYNMSNPNLAEQVWLESNSSVLALLAYRYTGFFASRSDGTVEFHYYNGISKDMSSFKIALSGADCDPVYDIASDGEDIFTCCRDSKIRRYRIAELIRNLTLLRDASSEKK